MRDWEQKRGTSFDYSHDGVILDNKYYHVPAKAYYFEEHYE